MRSATPRRLTSRRPFDERSGIRPLEAVLQPPLDDRHVTLRFHPHDDIDQPRGDRRAKEPRALDGGVGRRQLRQARRQYLDEQRAGLLEPVGVIEP